MEEEASSLPATSRTVNLAANFVSASTNRSDRNHASPAHDEPSGSGRRTGPMRGGLPDPGASNETRSFKEEHGHGIGTQGRSATSSEDPSFRPDPANPPPGASGRRTIQGSPGQLDHQWTARIPDRDPSTSRPVRYEKKTRPIASSRIEWRGGSRGYGVASRNKTNRPDGDRGAPRSLEQAHPEIDRARIDNATRAPSGPREPRNRAARYAGPAWAPRTNRPGNAPVSRPSSQIGSPATHVLR